MSRLQQGQLSCYKHDSELSSIVFKCENPENMKTHSQLISENSFNFCGEPALPLYSPRLLLDVARSIRKDYHLVIQSETYHSLDKLSEGRDPLSRKASSRKLDGSASCMNKHDNELTPHGDFTGTLQENSNSTEASTTNSSMEISCLPMQKTISSLESSTSCKLTEKYITGYRPRNPYALPKVTQKVFEFTELPFLILWVYLIYFLVLVSLTAANARPRVWLSAAIAGLLVGLGLNANAYRAIMYKGSPDYGMILRFFLIPFGVSALSGLTNSMREEFMLVFPKDPTELTLAICMPAIVVCTLLVIRLAILWKFRVPMTARNFLLNGEIFE